MNDDVWEGWDDFVNVNADADAAAQPDDADDAIESADTRPTPLPLRLEGIPDAMMAVDRWVVWNYEWVPPTEKRAGKWTKVPYIATAPTSKADSTDTTTWRSFADALAAFEDGKSDGIGFVLGDGWVGFDADKTHAPEYVHLLNTYTERSPSGLGVHAIAKGTKPGTKCRVGKRYELYDHGRYFTVTGHHLDGMPLTVEERTPQIAELYARLFPNGAASTPPPPPPSESATLDDDVLIAQATVSKNGQKFLALWRGDHSAYGSQSEADYALGALLAWWTNRNPAQMDRLFRRSGLMRPKWDEKRNDSTIGKDLIAKAIATTRGGYVPSKDAVIEEVEPNDFAQPVPVPYLFTPAFGPGHFVTDWIDHFSAQSDGALEYHEAGGLIALSSATHGLRWRLSGAIGAVRTNLYIVLLGPSTSSRKSSVKDYAVELVKRLPNHCAVLPEMASVEGMVEALADASGRAALMPIDEVKPLLDKLTHQPHLAGFKGLLLELYGRTHYEYKRASKRRKSKDGESETVEDAMRIEDVTLSILGCGTETVFHALSPEIIESGLMPRFAIVWPTGKPPRMPRYEMDDSREPTALINRLHQIGEQLATATVTAAYDVLVVLDEQVDLPIEMDASAGLMVKRLPDIAKKIAMLSAAGRPDACINGVLEVTMEDAQAAITVVRRWIDGAKRFEARLGESMFERKVMLCLDLVRGRTGHVNRRDIARKVRFQARDMKEVEETLKGRGHIEVVVQQHKQGGQPKVFWRWIEG